ncbi:YfhO family protein [Bacillus tuaregi]|uniref:YfhO family protein n=1 Tax=Bacillus tuaregi TaxID=1816695 RepID=UPI0008F87628|nr:YfhO family protein [Bacillus tuaregi]
MEIVKRISGYIGLFFTPILILFVLLWRLQVAPFGESSIWYIDLPSQLTMFYNHLYDVLKGSASPVYTWNFGMGTPFWATICYYLSSPLSILILLFPRSYIPYSILIIWLIKVGLSSISMSYLLKKQFTSSQLVIFIFSISYALMSFSITYYFLPMWIDAVFLLPIIIAGVHRIIKGEKHQLFLFSLALLFLANFYISYMVGIFVFLYFIAECIVQRIRGKERLNRFLAFFKSVFLAFLFTSFVTIPTYLAVKKNKYTPEDVDILSYLLNPLDVYGSFFNGTTIIQNLSIYAGLGVLLLVPLYFINQKYSIRERITYGLFLGFLLYSLTFTLLNMAWHVFEMPNGAHYRYAFLVSFLMIILSVKAVRRIDAVTIKQVVWVTLIHILFLSLANKLLEPTTFALGLVNQNILMLIFYAFFLLLLMYRGLSKKMTALIKIGLCLLVLGDLGLNSHAILGNYIQASYPHSWYNEHNPAYEKAIHKLQSMDQDFYRTKIEPELVTSQNESLRYKYKGMSIYTSTGDSDHNLFLRQLGYRADERTIRMEGGLFLSDALLGFKYIVTREELDRRIYTKVIEEDEIKVYQLKHHLPLGYMVSNQFMNDTKHSNPFQVQNRLLDGETDQLIYEKQAPPTDLIGLTEQTTSSGEKLLHKKAGEPATTMKTNINMKDTSQLYMQLDPLTYQGYEDKLDLFINKQPIQGSKVDVLNLVDLGTYENGELTIEVRLNGDLEQLRKPVFYTLNYSMLEQELTRLKQQSFQIKDYSDTSISGEITVQEDNQRLFLSIPYDENWKVDVNGVQAEIQKVGRFMAIPLDKGKHTIQLSYVPTTLLITLGVSLLSFISYLLSLAYKRRRKHHA